MNAPIAPGLTPIRDVDTRQPEALRGPRILAVRPPEAGLIAAGLLRLLPKGFYCGYRGPVLIVAVGPLDDAAARAQAAFRVAFANRVAPYRPPAAAREWLSGPPEELLGRCLGTARLASIAPAGRAPAGAGPLVGVLDRLGAFGPGRFAWMLEGATPLARPPRVASPLATWDEFPLAPAAALEAVRAAAGGAAVAPGAPRR